MKRKFTSKDVISILDYSKGKDIESNDILLRWLFNENNKIEKKDEHGLSVVGICEEPLLSKSNEEIGKLVVFKYSGVGGGWENDIYKMVEEKYFSNKPYYIAYPGDNTSSFYRFFLTGNIFKDKAFDEDWDRPNNTEDFRVFKQEIGDSELIITYDVSDEYNSADILNDKLRSDKDYCMYYDNSACTYYIKNIHKLNYKPSRQIIEERINKRKEDDKVS